MLLQATQVTPVSFQNVSRLFVFPAANQIVIQKTNNNNKNATLYCGSTDETVKFVEAAKWSDRFTLSYRIEKKKNRIWTSGVLIWVDAHNYKT